MSLQPCPTLCDPTDCSPPGSPVPRDSPGRNTGVGCCVLLQGVFPNQGWNLRLLHCRWISCGWVTGEAHSKGHMTLFWHISFQVLLVTFKKQCLNITSIYGFTSCFFVGKLVLWACSSKKKKFNCFYFLATLCGIQDLSSLTGAQICALCIGSLESHLRWTAREVPENHYYFFPENYFLNT